MPETQNRSDIDSKMVVRWSLEMAGTAANEKYFVIITLNIYLLELRRLIDARRN